MIVDSSAIVAILKNEPEATTFTEAIVDADDPKMSAASYVETGIVIDSRKNAVASRQLDHIIASLSIRIMDLTPEQAIVARVAHKDFGRGSGSPARLDFGDCLSYALASVLREPLLFKGNDFTHTDITPALDQRR